MPAALSPVNMRTPRSPPGLQPRQELPPALRGLGEPLGGAYDLAVAVVVHADGDHHGHVLVRASPASVEVYPVEVDIEAGALEEPVAPLPNGREDILVEFRDSGGRDAGAQKDFAQVLNAPGRDAREVHLDYLLLNRDLAPAVAFDARRGEPYALELGHVHRDLAGRRGQTSVVVPYAVCPALRGPFVASGADEIPRLLLERSVQGVFDGLSDELAKVGPQGPLVQCYDCFRRSHSPV